MPTTTNLFSNADADEVAAGDAVFRTGDEAECLYVVQSGKIEIRRDGVAVEVVGPGGIFGEMAVIDRSPRSADAIALEESRIVSIPERRFDFMVAQTPKFARVVMTVLAERLRGG